MSVQAFIVIALVVVIGSCAQASVGFGMGMIAAPVVALLEPALLPATLLLLAAALTLVVAIRARAQLDVRGIGWALLGRLPGGVAGALLLLVLPAAGISWVVVAVVLAGVAAALLGHLPRPTPAALAVAGFASGLMGTTTSIGGPPMALVWHGAEGPRLRGSMAMFFLIGSVASAVSLIFVGAIGLVHLLYAALLLPAAFAGLLLSRWVTRHLDLRRARIAAVAVSLVGVAILVAKLLL